MNAKGYCGCGCGSLAPISRYTHQKRGYLKGAPRRFISGHNGAHRPSEPLEDRYTVEDRGYDTACWIWQRTTSRKGYGRVWNPKTGKLAQAHRYFYELFVGPIPERLELDHLCRNTPCVNPAHLEPVTQAENQRRAREQSAHLSTALH